MAKRKENQWIPSGGVLAVALGAAVLAAILVNVYLGYAKSAYERGSQGFLQLVRPVAKGKPIEAADLKVVFIPKPLLETGAFKKAVTVEDKDSVIIKKKARRPMYEGEFLFYFDFLEDTGMTTLEPPPQGFEMMTIEIKPEPLLQPGSYVNIRGRFDTDPDPKKERIEVMDVLHNVQIKALDGSPGPVEEKKRAANNIQIVLRQSMAKQLQQVQESMVSKSFTVSLTGSPEGAARAEPKFDPAILALIEKAAAPPAAPTE